MDVTGDELAGIVALFGALGREELGRALVELAFKRGEDLDPAAFDADVDAAIESYHLVAAGRDAVEPADDLPADGDVLVPGPVAFPELPDGATDLPHILDVPDRTVDRDVLGDAVSVRFRADAEAAVSAGDEERAETLLDVSYELDVWAPVDVEDARARLNDVVA